MSPVETYRRGVDITRMALDGADWAEVGEAVGLTSFNACKWGATIFRLAKGHNPARKGCNIQEERRHRAAWIKRLDIVDDVLARMCDETAADVRVGILTQTRGGGLHTKEAWWSDVAATRAAIRGACYEEIAMELGVSSSTIGAGIRRVITLAAKADPHSAVPEIGEVQTMPELWGPRVEQIAQFLERRC